MKKSASIFVVSAIAAVMSFAPALSFAQAQKTSITPAPKFEGTITYSVSVPQLGDDKLPMITKIKGNKAATTIDMGAMGSQRLYVDADKRTMAMVMGEGKSGFELDMPNDTDAAVKAEMSQLAPTGKTETVDGYKSQEFTSSMKTGSMDIWATGDLPEGVRTGMIDAMKNNPQSGGSKAFSALITQGLAPVRITFITNGQTAATIDLVKFEQHSISDAEVVPPADVKLTHKTKEELMRMGGGQN